MIRISSIVEGDGEVAALPILLRRLNEWRTPEQAIQVLTPARVRRDRFLSLSRPEEFHRHLQLAAAKCTDSGWILILLDADDDCPIELGRSIVARAHDAVRHRRIAVVLANREYEAWFIASAASLIDVRNFSCTPADCSIEAETPRNAKGWMNARMGSRGYSVTLDQPALTSCIDLELAYARSRSFRKLCDEWSRNSQPT